MKSSNSLWKEKLAGQIAEPLSREIDAFETDIALRKKGKLNERLFAETRLRRGAYGQRSTTASAAMARKSSGRTFHPVS
jgi:sulfite reductase (ferredoxin)